MDKIWTPASRIRSLASRAVLVSNVPEASLLANTEYPASLSERARKVVQTYNKYMVSTSLLDKEESYIRSDASQNHLGPSSGLNGSFEGGIVPSIDLAIAPDERRLGMHCNELCWEGSIWSCIVNKVSCIQSQPVGI